MSNHTSIVNRTPHPITILAADGVAIASTLPAAPRGEVARVETTTVRDGEVDGIPLMRTRWGQIIGLPQPDPYTFHVVSVIVAEAAVDSGRGADDLLVPGDQVRDAQGRIVGCRGLCRAVSASPAMSGQRAYQVAMAIHRRTDVECENMRPEPDALAVEAEILVHALDSERESARRLRIEGGWAYNATEAHGSLRTALLSLCRETVTAALSDPDSSALGAREGAVARLVDVLEHRGDSLPLGRSGHDYVAGWPGREVTVPTLQR